MNPRSHHKEPILAALRMTGERLDWPGVVEIVIAGGAAGMMLGVWAHERVTEDCDIVDMTPAIQPRSAVMRAAKETAEALGWSPDWLNDHFMTFGSLDTLPARWRDRCQPIGVFRKLRVISLGRRDLLAMKLYAGRPQDVEDLRNQEESFTVDDMRFMREYLDSLKKPWRKHIKAEQLARAYRLLAVLESEVSK